VQASDAVGQIFSNYQAALLLLEEAGGDVTVSHETAREIFQPVLDACGGAVPGLDELVAEVVAEPNRVAATHSRLIRRRPGLEGPASAQLSELVTGTHSAGALFRFLQAKVRSGD
jgi:hypothetical protein